jgi:hypothetical protein
VNWYNDSLALQQPGFSGNSSGWVRSAICIDSAHTPDMSSITQFRFIFSADGSNNSGDGWAIDDMWVKIPRAQYDAGVKAIVNPGDTTITGDQITVNLEIKNFGFNTLTSIPLAYEIPGVPGSKTTETWTGSLATDQTTNYTFTTNYPGPSSDYQLITYTELNNDGNHFNDTAKANVVSKAAALDAGIVDVTAKGPYTFNGDSTLFGKDIEVEVKIHNYGSSTVNSLDVSYAQGSNTSFTETWNGTLAAGDTVTYKFNNTYPSPIGDPYEICSWTDLSGDANAANDTLCENWIGYVGIESQKLPGFILYQNIPNPAKGQTKIDFEVPYGGKAKFEVVDLYGRTIRVEEMSVIAGRHTVDLQTDDMSAGVYYYHVTFDGYRLVRKMVITK